MKVKKAYEITDAKIQFVSLVDKAANLKSFLITKAKDGQASFSTYGRLVAKDAERHFVTGVVYEPMAEDAHGNFMTEEEITKAAYYFAKAGGKIDLQHNFEPVPGAEVVESWVAKADFAVDGEAVKKGTWLMTVELSDGGLWDAIEKGEITGFSMGGVGNYSEEDVDLGNVEKSAEKKSIFKKLAETFGFEVVEKGEVADMFAERMQSQKFWTAFSTLEDLLCRRDYYSDKIVFEADESKIKGALDEFSQIIQELLTSGAPITKTLAADDSVLKAGKKLSGKNRDALQGIYDQLGTFLASFDEPEKKPEDDEQEQDPENMPPEGDPPEDGDNKDKEDKDVKKSEVEKLVQEAVAANVAKALGEQTPAASETAITPEAVQKMVEEAVAKALTPEDAEEAVTVESVTKMVEEAVAKAVEPVLKARGVPSALNDGDPVEKAELQHYLHGII